MLHVVVWSLVLKNIATVKFQCSNCVKSLMLLSLDMFNAYIHRTFQLLAMASLDWGI
jgi:hypothetical protein